MAVGIMQECWFSDKFLLHAWNVYEFPIMELEKPNGKGKVVPVLFLN